MTPTEVASVLGLDRVELVEAVALTDDQLAVADAAAAVRRAEYPDTPEGVVPRLPGAGQQRVRAMIYDDG